MTTLLINGKSHELPVEADMPLLWAIRDAAGLTGTKFGVGSSRVDLQACKLEYSIVSPK